MFAARVPSGASAKIAPRWPDAPDLNPGSPLSAMLRRSTPALRIAPWGIARCNQPRATRPRRPPRPLGAPYRPACRRHALLASPSARPPHWPARLHAGRGLRPRRRLLRSRRCGGRGRARGAGRGRAAGSSAGRCGPGPAAGRAAAVAAKGGRRGPARPAALYARRAQQPGLPGGMRGAARFSSAPARALKQKVWGPGAVFLLPLQ